MWKGSGDARAWRGLADLEFTAVPAQPRRLAGLRNALADWARETDLSDGQVEAAVLACYESLANAAAHAYEDSGVLDMRATYDSDSRTVEIIVRDHGQWRTPPRERGEIGGRGLILIRNLADHAEVTTGSSGTTVRMSWTARGAVPLSRDAQMSEVE